jgi:hypothetical protein
MQRSVGGGGFYDLSPNIVPAAHLNAPRRGDPAITGPVELVERRRAEVVTALGIGAERRDRYIGVSPLPLIRGPCRRIWRGCQWPWTSAAPDAGGASVCIIH